MLIRLLFFEKLQFPQVDLRILFFFFFSKSRVRASSEVQTQTNCYMYANQFNGPDLLENTIVKLKSVYVR